MLLRGKMDGSKLHLDGGVLPLPKATKGRAVFVRAEDVHIDASGQLRGKVETVTFLGTHYRVGISGITKDLLVSIHAGQYAPEVGDTVNISIKPNALMLLPDETGET